MKGQERDLQGSSFTLRSRRGAVTRLVGNSERMKPSQFLGFPMSRTTGDHRAERTALVRRRDGDPTPDYGPNSTEFSVEVHYDGYMYCREEPGREEYYTEYRDGKVSWFDRCDAETWCMFSIREVIEELGYPEMLGYPKDSHVHRRKKKKRRERIDVVVKAYEGRRRYPYGVFRS